MRTPTYLIALRYAVAIFVTAVFMFPIFWWGLTSIKPTSAIFNKDEVVWFDFEPTLINYRVTVMGESPSKLTGGSTGSGTTMGTGGENMLKWGKCGRDGKTLWEGDSTSYLVLRTTTFWLLVS